MVKLPRYMFNYFPYYCICICFLSVLGGCKGPESGSTDPAQNRYYNNYSHIYNNWGKVSADSTNIQLTRYLKEFPENADAWMLAGNLAYARADYSAAAAYYRSAIAKQPGQAVYYSALGAIFNTQHNLDSAEKYLLQAISLRDSSANTYLNASLLYLKKQNRAKSLAFADTAFARQQFSPIICGGLSFVYYQMKDTARGQKLFEEAVTFGLKDTLAFKEVLNGNMELQEYYQKHYQR